MGVIFNQGNLNVAALQAPGSYIKIIPPPSYVRGAPTDVFAILGTASWGPVGKPVLAGGIPDSQLSFGGVNSASPADPHDLCRAATIAFQQNISQSSNEGYLVRITHGDDTPATFTLQDGQMTPASGVILTAIFSGIFGNQISVNIQSGSVPNAFNVTIVPFKGARPEYYTNILGVAGSAASPFWVNLLNAINAGQNNVRGKSQLLIASTASSTAENPVVGTYTLSGGTDGRDVVSADFIGADGITGAGTGIYSLRGLPQPPGIIWLAGFTDHTQFAAIQAFVDSEAMLGLFSFPTGTTSPTAVSAKQGYGIDDPNCLFCKDWVYWQDTTNGVLSLVDPASFIGGMIACLSPEQSPGNKPVYGVVGTERFSPFSGNQPYSLSETGLLASNGVLFIANPIPRGNIWGLPHGKNSSSNPVTAPIEYSRLINYLARSLAGAMGLYVDELQTQQSTDPLRAAVKLELDTFLGNLKTLGQIDDFYTVCDLSNNSPSTIQQHYLFADVYVRFLASADFIVINLEGGTTVVTVNVTLPTPLAA
jgi:hypothetical protein